jgi:hypothetical protein
LLQWFCFLFSSALPILYGPRQRSRYSDWLRAGRSLLHVVQTGSGVHPTSYPMGTAGSFPSGKAARAWSWPLASNYCRGQENVDLYIHSPIRLHGVVLT